VTVDEVLAGDYGFNYWSKSYPCFHCGYCSYHKRFGVY